MTANGFGLQPQQRQAVEEQRELSERVQKLTTFIAGDTFKDVDRAEKSRLMRQLLLMEQLEHVLLERINAFGSVA